MGRLVRRYIRGYNITAVNHLETDTIVEHTSAAGVTIDGVKHKDSVPYVDTISEKTSGSGVTVDGCQIKDGLVVYKHAKILEASFGHATTETDTGVDLPDKAVVLAVWLEVTTADAGITIDVGTLSTEGGGDADGFIDGASVAATGLVIPDVTVTAGANENYFSACTIGALLVDFTAGSDTAGDVGTLNKKFYATDSQTAKSISYTCSTGADTAAGKIYILLVEFA